MRIIIANLLIAFCFIGYVEAQPVGRDINGKFVRYDNPEYDRLVKEEALRQAKSLKKGSKPRRSGGQNPNQAARVRRFTKQDVIAYLKQNPSEADIDNVTALWNRFERQFSGDELLSIIEEYSYSLLEVEKIDEASAKKPQNVSKKTKVKSSAKKKPSPKAIAPKANYRYSFSGSDCNVFAKTYGNSPIHLDSVSTVSVSIYEAKAPVRRLGYASPVGFTGNIRTVAGSIICVLRDNHPLSELMGYPNRHKKHRDDEDEVFNSSNFNSGALFPFDLMLMYKNEVGDALGFSIYNVEIISEGIVTSTNDMITEVVLQFQATHIDQIEKKS